MKSSLLIPGLRPQKPDRHCDRHGGSNSDPTKSGEMETASEHTQSNPWSPRKEQQLRQFQLLFGQKLGAESLGPRGAGGLGINVAHPVTWPT